MVSENTTDDKWFNSSLANSLASSWNSSSASSSNSSFFRKGNDINNKHILFIVIYYNLTFYKLLIASFQSKSHKTATALGHR